MHTELHMKYKRLFKKARDHMNREQVIEIRDEIQDEIDSLADEISEAKRRAAKTGEYADPEWYRDTNEVIRIKRRMVQRLNNLMGRKKREAGQKVTAMKTETLAEHFMAEAETALPEETYQKILDCACQKLAQRGNREKVNSQF